jgi:hypothetical protein
MDALRRDARLRDTQPQVRSARTFAWCKKAMDRFKGRPAKRMIRAQRFCSDRQQGGMLRHRKHAPSPRARGEVKLRQSCCFPICRRRPPAPRSRPASSTRVLPGAKKWIWISCFPPDLVGCKETRNHRLNRNLSPHNGWQPQRGFSNGKAAGEKPQESRAVGPFASFHLGARHLDRVFGFGGLGRQKRLHLR